MREKELIDYIISAKLRTWKYMHDHAYIEKPATDKTGINSGQTQELPTFASSRSYSQ